MSLLQFNILLGLLVSVFLVIRISRTMHRYTTQKSIFYTALDRVLHDLVAQLATVTEHRYDVHEITRSFLLKLFKRYPEMDNDNKQYYELFDYTTKLTVLLHNTRPWRTLLELITGAIYIVVIRYFCDIPTMHYQLRVVLIVSTALAMSMLIASMGNILHMLYRYNQYMMAVTNHCTLNSKRVQRARDRNRQTLFERCN